MKIKKSRLGGCTLATLACLCTVLTQGATFQAVPLEAQRTGERIVLTWTNTAFHLQTAPSLSGTFTSISGATSPWTNSINSSQQYYRLILKPLGLHANGTNLTLNGQEWKGYGVNYFDAFYRTVQTRGADTSYTQGLAVLKLKGIPFIRFDLVGFYASEWQYVFQQTDHYLLLLDAFLAECGRNNLGVIPSFFWNYRALPDYCGEDSHKWGVTNSATFRAMQNFTRLIVERYKDNPVIWAWEFGNEYASLAPLPLDCRNDPYSLNVADCSTAYQGFATEVLAKDPHKRLLSTGDSKPHPAAWHLISNGTWNSDSPADLVRYLNVLNPAEYVVSLHIYPDVETGFAGVRYFGQSNFSNILASYIATTRSINRVCFVGEFGASWSVDFNGDRTLERTKFQELLGAMETAGVPLAALWVFDFPHFDSSWNVTQSNERSYQLDAIGAANRRFGH